MSDIVAVVISVVPLVITYGLLYHSRCGHLVWSASSRRCINCGMGLYEWWTASSTRSYPRSVTYSDAPNPYAELYPWLMCRIEVDETTKRCREVCNVDPKAPQHVKECWDRMQQLQLGWVAYCAVKFAQSRDG